MTLIELIRNRGTRKAATAIPATAATDNGRNAGTVARIATVAVASLTTDETAHYRWRLTWPAGRTLELCAVPEFNRRDVEARYPGAIAEALPNGEFHSKTMTEQRAQTLPNNARDAAAL